MKDMPSHEKRFFGLDFARALAIFFIVSHHFFVFAPPPAWLLPLGCLGAIGVEVFFGLFGFFLGQSLLRVMRGNRFSTVGDLGQLYLNRSLRILPAYYCFFLVSTLIFPPFYPQFAIHLDYLVFLQNFAWRMPPFFFQSWTLSIIEFFYFFFLLVLFLIYKRVHSIRLGFFLALAPFIIVPLFLRILFTPLLSPEDFEAIARKLVIYRLDAPVAGVLMALIQGEYPKIWSWLQKHSWIGLTLLAGVSFYYFKGFPYLYSSHFMEVMLFLFTDIAFALLLPFLCTWKETGAWPSRVILMVSKFSYSVYVSHFVAMNLGLYLYLLWVSGPVPSYLVLVPLFYTSVSILAYITYLTVELPFILLRERWQQGKVTSTKVPSGAQNRILPIETRAGCS